MAASTLFVRNLPASATNGRMEEIFSEIGPVKNCFVVKEKGTDKCRGFGYVTFAMVDDSQRALREIKEYDGKKISVVVAKRKQNDKKKAAPKQPTPENQKPKGLKKNQLKARLIIRNLSFKCSADDLRQVFSEFGTVLDVNIPLKPDGKMRGFAFVQLKNVLQAGKALKATNLKEIKGRPVAVDWAVAKDKFVAAQQASSSGATKQPAEQEQGTEEDSQPKKPSAKTAAKEVRHSKQEVDPESDSESESAEQDSEEDDDDDDDDDDEDDEEEEEEASAAMDSDHSGSGSDEDDDEDDDDDDDDGDSDEEPPVKRKPLPSDVKEGRTVFIRNLSFETEEEGLEEVLLQYGELKYIRIVLHPDTEHSKGCAFAQFKTKEAADRCLAAAQDQSESGGIRVDGRKLNVVLAVSREDAVKLKDDKKVKVQTGTRNLYLAREGLIRAGTKAAEGIPAADMAKRARFEELKRVKLRDIQVFVSKTRLCVHNLPKSVDQKQLRALCLKAAGGGKGVRITECRVMYDKKPEAGKIMGRSLGYGFVQFQNHDHALSVLRHLNNNPEIFGPQKRPIVEFSLEDGRKLKMKEMRSQKQAQRMRKGVAPGGAQPQKAGGGASKVPQKSGGGASKGPQKSGGGASKGPQQSGGGASKRPAESGGGAGNPAGGVSSHFSGFRTKPEVEEVELADGKKRKKVLPLPKKSGPKIRNRDRGKVQPTQPKQKPHRPSRRDRVAGLSMEKQSQPPLKRATKGARKPLRNREDQRFDSLVEQYKRRIMGNPSKPAVKKSKWFSS